MYESIVNLMISICVIVDKSFFLLFLFYGIIYLIIGLVAFNIEKLMGIPIILRWYDFAYLIILIVIFAYNSYWLHNIKAADLRITYELNKDK